MAESTDQQTVKRLKTLKGQRTGKKGSITKRINQLNTYIEDKKGRRATELLLQCLLKVFSELEEVCISISDISDEYDQKNDIEEIRFEVESCAAGVQEYLESRIDDPESSSSSKALEWVRRHAGQFGNSGEATSSESGESEVKVHDLDTTVKQPSNDVRGRLIYSDSRPATPAFRKLPQIPAQIPPTPINIILAADEKDVCKEQNDRASGNMLSDDTGEIIRDEEGMKENGGGDTKSGDEGGMTDQVIAPTPAVTNVTSFIFQNSRANNYVVSDGEHGGAVDIMKDSGNIDGNQKAGNNVMNQDMGEVDAEVALEELPGLRHEAHEFSHPANHFLFSDKSPSYAAGVNNESEHDANMVQSVGTKCDGNMVGYVENRNVGLVDKETIGYGSKEIAEARTPPGDPSVGGKLSFYFDNCLTFDPGLQSIPPPNSPHFFIDPDIKHGNGKMMESLHLKHLVQEESQRQIARQQTMDKYKYEKQRREEARRTEIREMERRREELLQEENRLSHADADRDFEEMIRQEFIKEQEELEEFNQRKEELLQEERRLEKIKEERLQLRKKEELLQEERRREKQHQEVVQRAQLQQQHERLREEQAEAQEKFERESLQRLREEKAKEAQDKLQSDQLERLRKERAKQAQADEAQAKFQREQFERQQAQAKEAQAKFQREQLERQQAQDQLRKAQELERQQQAQEQLRKAQEFERQQQAQEFERQHQAQEQLRRAQEEQLEQEQTDRLESWRIQSGAIDVRSQATRSRADDDNQSQVSSKSSSHFSASHVIRNHVDSWIDELDIDRSSNPLDATAGPINQSVLMASLMQQHLPQVKIPQFGGDAINWVEFIVKFRDVVHEQPYLSDRQRNQLLMQHLKEEAKRAVQEYVNDPRGYPLSLKKLKYLFGQRPTVAKAVLSKVTKGSKVLNRDTKGLADLYYSICDCLVTLKQLNYLSDLNSSDTLAQAVRRLPDGLCMKWAERSLWIRKQNEEPNLYHLEQWLKDRVLAQREVYPMNESGDTEGKKSRRKGKFEETHVGLQVEDAHCLMCKKKGHSLSKCQKYKALKPADRAELIQKLRRCFNCFSDEHMASDCSSKYRCFESDCGRKHHTTLHQYFFEKYKALKAKRKEKRKEKESDDKEADAEEKEEVDEAITGLNVVAEKPTEEITIGASMSSKSVFLLIVPVTVHVNGKSFDTYALLDNGSQSTIIRNSFFQKFGVPGETTKLYETTIKDKAQEPTTVKILSVRVSARDGSNPLNIQTAYVQPPNMFNMPSRPRLGSKTYPHLKGLQFEAVEPDEITILIGGNAAAAHLYSDTRVGGEEEPIALKTRFGWTLFGQSVGQYDSRRVHCATILTEEALDQSVTSFWEGEEYPTVFINRLGVEPYTDADASLEKAVEKFWVQEHCGILPLREVTMSSEDKAAMQRLETETRLVDGRYVVPMLWAKSDLSLPNNLPVAKKMFNNLLRRFRADPDMHQKIREVINGYLKQDPPHARIMTPEEVAKTSSKTWTLPTHPVTNPNKPGKVRLVNNAAAVYQNVSLNSSLVTGPDLLNRLVGVLMRFRCGKVAIAADIEAMFHQVRVNADDADALRFLWKDDITTDDPPEMLQMLVHIFGAKDSPTVANYALQRTARDNCDRFDALTLYSVLKSFYVDDLLKSIEDVATAVRLAMQLMEMLKCGGFRLCKFTSNNPEVLKALPKSEVSPSTTFEIEAEEKMERALGISWETTRDVLTFTTKFKDNPPTKRGVLKTTSSLFDPTGFLAPFVLRAKIILQTLWRRGYGWDDLMDEELQTLWNKWLESAKKLSAVRIPRQYVDVQDRGVAECQLHVFCDASEDAYGAVTYVRYSFKDGKHECSFVMAKSRLAPIRAIKLPQLELESAQCGAILGRMVVHELDLPIQRIVYWSDSTITLQYIKNKQHRMKARVANRVTEILTTSEAEQWHHVPGTINPADLLTRGVSDPTKLLQNRWFVGPEFLENEEDDWPSLSVDPLDPEDAEIKRRPIFVGMSLVETESIRWDKISSWPRLLRVASWVVRFADLLRHRNSGEEEKRLDTSLTVAELKEAEYLVLRDVQKTAFSEEIDAVFSKKPLPRSSMLSGLCPFMDESQVLRVGGRLKKIEQLSYEVKHQIILPRQHPVTKVLVEHIHRRNGHVGPEHVHSLVREKYWVITGRVLASQVVSRCFFCRVRKAKESFPYMADLPKCRAAINEPPFSHCGVDLFGPIIVKHGRQRLKRWGCLFTCMTVRCIHLEIVESCETDSFINAVRRFTNRRGCPTDMYSDNGTNFRGATSELKEFVEKLDKASIEGFAASFQIQWHFNPPSAPHMGGAWERLVRSSKEVLYGLVKDHVLTDSQLLTVLTEVEHIVNSRPLTHISESPDDLSALTPNHILLGRHRNWESISDISASDISSRKKWKQVQALQSTFWIRWVKEYLPTLTKRPCWRDHTPEFKEGELVLLRSDDVKRGKWPLGRISKTMPGADGVVRVVEVKTKTGYYERPVSKLLKLEDNDS